MTKPLLHSVKCGFTQEGNTLGTTDSTECLEITLESQEGIEKPDDLFIVLKTATGWSMDSVDELASLVDRMKKMV